MLLPLDSWISTFDHFVNTLLLHTPARATVARVGQMKMMIRLASRAIGVLGSNMLFVELFELHQQRTGQSRGCRSLCTKLTHDDYLQ